MTLIERQFLKLQENYPEATRIEFPDGSSLLTVPGIVLPEGWSRNITAIRFVVPVGYPAAQPDCFWADAGLTLAGGATPQSSGVNNPPDGNPQLWFSWHLGKWSPNSDTLATYVNVIKERLNPAR